MAYTIYIASKFHSRYRLRPLKKRLQDLGFTVLSKWMDPDVNIDPSSDIDSIGVNLEESKAEAERDSAEIANTDIFIIDTLDESNSGGRDVELGMVMATGRALGIYRIGPVRNVFHAMIPAHNNWEDLINYLKENFPND